MNSERLERVIAQASRFSEEFGAAVFPVRVEPDPERPGKTRKLPLVKGWQNGAAVTSAEAIDELFRAHPNATHAGIQTGRIVVVDLDGPQALEWWRKHTELLPPTRTVDTQREGGRHLYYRVPPGCDLRNSASKIAAGIDFRGAGGFVVDWSVDNPPGVEDITDAPAALIEFLRRASTAKPAASKSEGSERSDRAIAEGGRNASLTSLAGKMRRVGADHAEILAGLCAFNEARCRPPLQRDELETIAASVARYEPAESGEWPEPVNIFAELQAPELRPEYVPACLAEYPAAYAKAAGFDPSLTLSAAISTAAAALSDGFSIVGNSQTAWFQHARLWVLGIGRPATGKTPAQREMLAPLWSIQKELREQHERECQDEDSKPPRLILTDTTIEALSEVLRVTPRGVLVANDEFEGWLGSLDTYRRGQVSRDRGEWLRAFDGGPHTIERVQRGSLYVANWGVSILSATTPAALAKMTRHLPEDGLLQRFLPIIARSRSNGQAAAGIEDARSNYAELIRRLYAAQPRAHKGAVSLSFEAQRAFERWLGEQTLVAEAFGSVAPALEAHFSKYPTFLLRLMLTFHAAEVVSLQDENARDPAAWPVPLRTFQIATDFLKQASRHAIAMYVSPDGGSETFDLTRDIGRAILARDWKVVARRDLVQSVRAFRKAEAHLQDAALRLAEDFAWLRRAEGGYDKPVPARFDVNPTLAERFAAIATRERERRSLIRSQIKADATDQRGFNS